MSDTPSSFSAGRRWSIALSVAAATVAALALAVMANYLAARHFTRAQWRGENPNQLSAQTLTLLHGLTNEVNAIVFYSREDSQEFYSTVAELLAEYRRECPKLTVEPVDYLSNPTAAMLIKDKYKLVFPGNDYLKPMVIFECGGRPKAVYEKDLYELDYESVIKGRTKEVKRSGFKGELKFTEAINSVTDTKQLKAWYVQGHQEHGLDDDGALGYSKLAAVIQQQNIQLDTLLLTEADIPADCNLLIIAGPCQPFEKSELEKIDRYLSRGGRLVAAFRPWNPTVGGGRRTGLEDILARWGVRVGNNVVEELDDGGQKLKGETSGMIVNRFSTGHPIMKQLLKSQLFMLLPRTVEKQSARQDADAPRVDELASTGTNCLVNPSPESGVLDLYRARRGPVAVIASVEKGSVQGLGADRGSTRVVVTGDSVFLANSLLDRLGNRDFAVQMVNWLVDNPRLMGGIGPRPIKEYRVIMSRGQMSSVRWLLLVVFPGAVLCLGFMVWLRRRN